MQKQDGDKLIFQKGGNLTSWVMGTVVFLLPGGFAVYVACTLGSWPGFTSPVTSNPFAK